MFDAVITAFGLSVVPQWHAALSSSWRLLRPGGAYAILDLHFTKGDDGEATKDEQLAEKVLPSQDHSRRLWDALEMMPMVDECTVHTHGERQHYYCAVALKQKLIPADLDSMAEKGKGDENAPIRKWDPDKEDYVDLDSEEELKELAGEAGNSAEAAAEEPAKYKLPEDFKVPVKGSSETIKDYSKRVTALMESARVPVGTEQVPAAVD